MEGNVLDPTFVDPAIDFRSISFENPTGARGAGGKAAQGRKGRPNYVLEPGERLILADIKGRGTVRHIWTMLTKLRPEIARAVRLEVFYDGRTEPSISVPYLDFFGLPHGRVAEYYSALTAVHEGRGLNSYIPMPFNDSIRIDLSNESSRHVLLFFQIDYTLDPVTNHARSYLHATFRRENPTHLLQDFVIADGLRGPGRFLGCSVGIRVTGGGTWYGEGEVKIYKDGDGEYPTYCGTGLEDYVGSAYGLGRHHGYYAGCPLQIPTTEVDAMPGIIPTFVGFYRWHLPDPIMFADDLRVTIQQIGIGALFKKGQESALAAYKDHHEIAGAEWTREMSAISNEYIGPHIVERTDDYCATAYMYCREPQDVPRYDTAAATRDLEPLKTEDSARLGMSEDEAEQMLAAIAKSIRREETVQHRAS
jgi:hypothetical protein